MSIITVDINNIDEEHICCAISERKGENCVPSKKAWLKERFKDGLVFKKLDVRGKVFIEYIPAEKAFAPIVADNYIYINCFWVSGKYKGQGYGSKLLNECIIDAKEKGKDGLVILSAKKKMSYLSDPKYLKHKGFKLCDTAKPYYELLYIPFNNKADIPSFKENAKKGEIEEMDIVLYYSNQCPHTAKYVPIIEKAAIENGIGFRSIKLDSIEAAQSSPAPFTTYSLYINGKFETNEILTEKKFIKIVKEKGLL